ncbi:MAG: ribonuclease Y [Candidatus Saccharimonadaceae bacterium]|nr:ribonuclease Y [Candidatus Saccharimonadaceae bacterium]
MDPTLVTILIIVSALGGLGVGIMLVFVIPTLRAKTASKKAEKIIRDAEIKAEHTVKSAQIDAKQVAYEMKLETEKELKERKAEYLVLDNKLSQRESNIDRRDAQLIAKENVLEEKTETLNRRLKEAERKEEVLQQKIDSIIEELEKVAQLSVNEARDEIFQRVESKLSREIAAFIKNKEDEAKETAQEKARELIGLAINKYSQEVTTERTVSAVSLPSDEMKGRIIGREGRNIRSLEQLLGVDLIIDDTPEVITVSCFDPIRREIAKLTLERLIKDGRIQPGRIEEVVEKVKVEVDESIRKAGEDAAFKLGLPRINKELLTYVGRLKYRTSYGQNAYDHAMEVAYLAGIMAVELGLDQNLAKRAGLLHDIGKSMDFEIDGSHVEIGVRLAKKYGEPDVVINSIESHHGDVEPKFVISHLVAAADTLSAARPGARSETVENYIKRIEKLENLCKSYDGVYQSYAMQSGREVRVMVIPEKIDDLAAYKLARDIREKIENERTYPGQIKVSVIREYRATETAK